MEPIRILRPRTILEDLHLANPTIKPVPRRSLSDMPWPIARQVYVLPPHFFLECITLLYRSMRVEGRQAHESSDQSVRPAEETLEAARDR